MTGLGHRKAWSTRARIRGWRITPAGDALVDQYLGRLDPFIKFAVLPHGPDRLVATVETEQVHIALGATQATPYRSAERVHKIGDLLHGAVLKAARRERSSLAAAMMPITTFISRSLSAGAIRFSGTQ